MAVTVFRNGKEEHHRNPSGMLNKANWLVVQSKRDVTKVHELVRHNILMKDYKMLKSWRDAELVACFTIRYDYKNPREYWYWRNK